MLVRISTPIKGLARERRRLRRSLEKMSVEVAPCDDMELSVLLADDEEMRRLNREYRSMDEPTDVLSFPQLSPRELEDVGSCEGEQLGDIVIGIDAARRQAALRGHSTGEELDLLAAHGLLHLLGFSHENEEQARAMEQAERKLTGGSIIGKETGD